MRAIVAALMTAAVVVVPVRAVSASCVSADQLPPSVTVTGVAVDATVNGAGALPGRSVTLRLDDGTTRRIELLMNVGETSVSDPYAGPVPEVGGRYRITGRGDGTTVHLNGCVPDAAVEVLAAPPPPTAAAAGATTVAAPLVTSTERSSRWVPVALGLLAGLGIGVLLVGRRRRGATG